MSLRWSDSVTNYYFIAAPSEGAYAVLEEVAASSFEDQFKELTSLITYFEQCSLETQQFIDHMKAALQENLKTDLMTDTERQRLQSYSAKKSTLLVVGQTNSGKSSFVNELLGGSFMPTSEVPCTSRIVRLKYSQENYVQVMGYVAVWSQFPLEKDAVTASKAFDRQNIDYASVSRVFYDCVVVV